MGQSCSTDKTQKVWKGVLIVTSLILTCAALVCIIMMVIRFSDCSVPCSTIHHKKHLQDDLSDDELCFDF